MYLRKFLVLSLSKFLQKILWKKKKIEKQINKARQFTSLYTCMFIFQKQQQELIAFFVFKINDFFELLNKMTKNRLFQSKKAVSKNKNKNYFSLSTKLSVSSCLIKSMCLKFSGFLTNVSIIFHLSSFSFDFK